MAELDSVNHKYKDCMKDVEKLKMDLRYLGIYDFFAVVLDWREN